MNYIREAEQYLYHFRDLQRSEKNLERDIERLAQAYAPAGYPQRQLDGMPRGDGQPEELENVAFQLDVLQQSLTETRQQIARISAAIDSIGKDAGCEQYPAVLRMWYIEKLPKEEIAEALHYGRRQSVYELRGKAIRKFAVNLFGISVLKVT